MKLQSGHEVTPLEGSELEKQLSDWKGYRNGLIRLTPGRWLYPTRFQQVADRIYNFQHKKSDVVIMTYPKCGTTWSQEIIWNMINNPNLDNKEAAAAPVLIRSPFIEFDALMPEPNPAAVANSDDAQFKAFREICPGRDALDGINVQLAECIPEPRTIKTHLPLSLMAPSMLDTCKVVYVARNPKDTIVSYEHHCRLIIGHKFVGSFADFVQYFVDDDLLFGSYWLHLKEAWEKREHPNLLFLFYEDMKADPLKEIKKIDAFLGTNLTEAQLKGIVQYTSFDSMKARDNFPVFKATVQGKEIEILDSNVIKKDGGFFRKGESGGWKSKFTPDLEAKVDDWTRKYLDPVGISFKYEI